MRHYLFCAVATVSLVACTRNSWPDPPPVDQGQYQKDYDSWRDQQRGMLSQVLPIVGIWPLQEGETPFGADTSLPIALPAKYFPPRAGVLRREGDRITVIPAPGAPLRQSDGTALEQAATTESFAAGPVQMQITSAGDRRRWLMAMDESHPAIKNPPPVDAYPLDSRWRVAARFDAFGQPRRVQVPDVRGGMMEFTAAGRLTFRVSGQEMNLTAFSEPESDEFFVMFKDATNQSSTFSGYRILSPKVVKNSAWTVVDFNFAMNPPCAYSRYTVCPLPPPENKLPVAIEAGLKRLPSAQGYSE